MRITIMCLAALTHAIVSAEPPKMQTWRSRDGRATSAVFYSLDADTGMLTLLQPKSISIDLFDERSKLMARRLSQAQPMTDTLVLRDGTQIDGNVMQFGKNEFSFRDLNGNVRSILATTVQRISFGGTPWQFGNLEEVSELRAENKRLSDALAEDAENEQDKSKPVFYAKLGHCDVKKWKASSYSDRLAHATFLYMRIAMADANLDINALNKNCKAFEAGISTIAESLDDDKAIDEMAALFYSVLKGEGGPLSGKQQFGAKQPIDDSTIGVEGILFSGLTFRTRNGKYQLIGAVKNTTDQTVLVGSYNVNFFLDGKLAAVESIQFSGLGPATAQAFEIPLHEVDFDPKNAKMDITKKQVMFGDP